MHHNIVVKRKKRLIVLMALDRPNVLYDNDASDTAALRQYTYIDYKEEDWLDKLLYALPLHGMYQANRVDQGRDFDNAIIKATLSPTLVGDAFIFYL